MNIRQRSEVKERGLSHRLDVIEMREREGRRKERNGDAMNPSGKAATVDQRHGERKTRRLPWKEGSGDLVM